MSVFDQRGQQVGTQFTENGEQPGPDYLRFSKEERSLLMYMTGVFQPHSFNHLIYELAFKCDEANLAKMDKAWPAVVATVRDWRSGNLAERAREARFNL